METVPERGSYAIVPKIKDLFYPKPKNLIEKTRFYIREGDALYWDQKKGKRTLCYLFLFNDCMLLAKKQPDLAGHKYNLKYFISLNSTSKLEHGKEPVEFRLHLKTMSLIFFVRSSEEKNIWLSDINASIKGIHVSNYSPMSVQPAPPRESKSPSQGKERSASKGQMNAHSSKDKMRAEREPPHNPPQPKKSPSSQSSSSKRGSSGTSANHPRTRPPSEKQPAPQSKQPPQQQRSKRQESSEDETDETSSEYETTSSEMESTDSSSASDGLSTKDDKLPLIQPGSETPFTPMPAFTMPAFNFDLSPSTPTSVISNFSKLSVHDELPPSDLPPSLPSPTAKPFASATPNPFTSATPNPFASATPNPFASTPNPFTSSTPTTLTTADSPPSYVPPSLHEIHQQQFDSIFGLPAPQQQNVNPFASPVQPAPQANPFFANNPFKTGQ